MKKAIIIGGLVAAVAVPAGASAHVTIQPREIPADGFARLNVRVPNEQDDAGTTKVAVRFPPGFYSVSYEAVPGWQVDVKMRKLRKPVKDEDETITEEVAQVVLTGDGQTGIVGPGQFRDFGLSTRIPNKPGKTLTFKALQTYENGDVSRWIGGPEAERPAPRLALLPPAEEHGAATAPEPEDEEAETEAAAATDDGEDEDDDDSGLALIALIVGGLGLLLGVASLVRKPRTA